MDLGVFLVIRRPASPAGSMRSSNRCRRGNVGDVLSLMVHSAQPEDGSAVRYPAQHLVAGIRTGRDTRPKSIGSFSLSSSTVHGTAGATDAALALDELGDQRQDQHDDTVH